MEVTEVCPFWTAFGGCASWLRLVLAIASVYNPFWLFVVPGEAAALKLYPFTAALVAAAVWTGRAAFVALMRMLHRLPRLVEIWEPSRHR
jgi:hypothetical protein